MGEKRYFFVCVDGFLRYTWISFSREKYEIFDVFKDLCQHLQREKESGLVIIRSDHGKEFENSKFHAFCSFEGIVHEFSAPITPPHNGVVEHKNGTLQESSRVMLHVKNLSYYFLAEAMNTSHHIHNRVTIRSRTKATRYELWKWRKPNVKYFHVFGSRYYILVDHEQRKKMDPKSDEGTFLGYSTNSRVYKVYNKHTKTMVESINVIIDDNFEDKKEVKYEVSHQQIDVPAYVQHKESDIEFGSRNVENP